MKEGQVGYRVCWSLALAVREPSGVVDGLLSAYDDRMMESNDRLFKRTVQAERDPYIHEASELGFAIKKPRRRGVS